MVAAADVPDYSFLWWDIRPHPKLGTLEVRAMDAQARLGSVLGPRGARPRARARAAPTAAPTRRGAGRGVVETSFRAGRDGLDATIRWRGACARARGGRRDARGAPRRARELGAEDALEEVERILREGNGADRMRARHARGGMAAVLSGW